ncbi:MAG: HAD family hydrolase [Chloroflexota bacterium]
MLTPPEAILFDVYETLVENERPDWVEAFARICEQQSLPLTGEELYSAWKAHEVEFRRRRTDMGSPENSPAFKPYREAWQECFRATFNEHGIAGDAVHGAEVAVDHMASRFAYPETHEALEELSKRVRLGVFSNADNDFLRPLFHHNALWRYFDVVISSEDAGVYKPHPDAFRHILSRMGVDERSAWYVGDHPYDDILGASTAGVTAIWQNRFGQPLPEGRPTPDHTITNLMDLTALYDSIAGEEAVIGRED